MRLSKIQEYVRAKLDEPRPPKPPTNRTFKPLKSLKDGAKFRPKVRNADPLKRMKRIFDAD